MAFEGRDVTLVDRVDAFAHFGGELRREMTDVFGDVAPPFAERRQLDAEDRETEEEVSAKTAGGDLPFEVAVRGGDQAHVDPCGAGLADLDELPAFEHPQQLGLQFGGHLPYFVEEQRAFVGLLEKSFFVLGSSREAACAVAEELAFEQLLRKGRTVDRDEGFPGPGTGVVDGLGEDLLAGARLAREQHRGIRDGDLAGQLHGPAQGFRTADDPVERMLFGQRVVDTRQSPLHPGFFDRTAQQGQDLVVVVALGDVIEGAVLDGLHPVGDVAVGRQQDHLG